MQPQTNFFFCCIETTSAACEEQETDSGAFTHDSTVELVVTLYKLPILATLVAFIFGTRY